jgi:hypothetical protein
MPSKNWEDMTVDDKLDWLRHEDQSTRRILEGLSNQTASAIQTLQKRIADLEARAWTHKRVAKSEWLRA